MTSGKKKEFKFKKKISVVNAMQIASEAIRLTFKHWPPLEGLTRQPYCLAINLHLITHNVSLVGGNLLGNTPLWWGLGTIWLLLFTRLSHVLVPET